MESNEKINKKKQTQRWRQQVLEGRVWEAEQKLKKQKNSQIQTRVW